MKPYSANTNAGRIKSCDDIHHKTADGGKTHRNATAKAQRKAARQEGKRCSELIGDDSIQTMSAAKAEAMVK